ncbi:MAG: MFS transporter [Lactobacillaceae bacterium]|jgi:MFS family permease|nr:MFS transporter [Lactobacillaceae bacterium]
MNKITKDIKTIMTFRAVRAVSDAFFNTFLIAYIMQIANNNIIPISLYQIVYAFFVGIGFLIFADFAKRRNKMILFRTSLILNFAYLLIIMIFQEKILNYVSFLGALYGIAVTLYALPYNVIISEKVNKKTMSKFYGYTNAINGGVAICAPLALGAFITFGSFAETAFVLAIIAAIEFIISLFIKSQITSSKKFELWEYLKNLKQNALVRKVYIVEYLKGITINGTLPIALVLYVVYVFKTNLNLGILTSIFTFCAVVMNFIFGRFATRKSFPKLLTVSGSLAILSSFVFIFFTTKTSFILYNFCYITAVQLLLSITDINLFNVSNDKHIKNKFKIEYFAVRETFLNMGRISGFILLFFIGIINNLEYIKYLMAFLTILIALIGFLSIKLNIHINDEEEEF